MYMYMYVQVYSANKNTALLVQCIVYTLSFTSLEPGSPLARTKYYFHV